MGSSSGQIKPKTLKLVPVLVAYLLIMLHLGVRANNSWLRIRIMCPSGATCLPTDCCFRELTL